MEFDIQPLPNVTLYPAAYPGFILALKFCVGTTCVLSILGGLAIIIHYARTKSTDIELLHVLVCVSIADILVAWGHLWGISTDLERFLDVYYPGNTTAIRADQQCSVQAVLAIYGTITSFLWTMLLAVLVLVTMKCERKTVEKALGRLAFTIYHLIFWVSPMIGVCILARLKLLGYNKVDVGWCYTVHLPQRSGRLLLLIFSYEVWTYITFFILLLFSLWSFCLVGCKCCKKTKGRNSGPVRMQRDDERTVLIGSDENQNQRGDHRGKIQLEMGSDENLAYQNQRGDRRGKIQLEMESTETDTNCIEIKLIVVALMLIILRSFSFVIDTFSYAPDETTTKLQHSWAMILLIFAGIGDSAQGFANAVVFLLFTTETRDWIKRKCPCFKPKVTDKA